MSDDAIQQAPDYDVDIDADQLLKRLAEQASNYGEDYEEKRSWWTESPAYDEFHEARHWMLEARGGQRAYSEAIAALQPEQHSVLVDCYRFDDGTVDVRGFLKWLSEAADEAHDRSGGPSSGNWQANEAESAYASIISVVREEYGVGWPRINDLGGIMEADKP